MSQFDHLKLKACAIATTAVMLCSPELGWGLAVPSALQISPLSVAQAAALQAAPFQVSREQVAVDEVVRNATAYTAVAMQAKGYRGAIQGDPKKDVRTSLVKDAADGGAKLIMERLFREAGVEVHVHSSEGFGRDGVEESFKANEVVNLGGSRVIHANMDVVEGTNALVTNNRGKEQVFSDESGATSTIVVGAGVEILGNAQDMYADQLFTSVPADKRDEVQAIVQDLFSLEPPVRIAAQGEESIVAWMAEAMETVLVAIAQANGITVNDLEFVTMARSREGRRDKARAILTSKYQGLKITAIPDGTMAHGLLASIGQLPGRGSSKHKVLWTTGGTPEAMMNLAVAASLGSVGVLKIYSKRLGKDKDFDFRYGFSESERRELAEVRADRGDAAAIIAGTKVFTVYDVIGDVQGSFSMITDNGVFNLPGVRERQGQPGVYEVHSLVIANGQASVDVREIAHNQLLPYMETPLSNTVKEFLKAMSKYVMLSSAGGEDVHAVVVNDLAFQEEGAELLAREASLNANPNVRQVAQWLARKIGPHFGVREASIHAFYRQRYQEYVDYYAGVAQAAEPRKVTIPAINIRTGAFETLCDIFREAKRQEVGALIIELAKSETRYTAQSPAELVAMGYAAAIAVGYKGLLFFQGDHYQTAQDQYAQGGWSQHQAIQSIKDFIDQSLKAGELNIDVDPSTLVDEATLTRIALFENVLADAYLSWRRGEDPDFAVRLEALESGDESGLKSLRRQVIDDLAAVALGFSARYLATMDPAEKSWLERFDWGAVRAALAQIDSPERQALLQSLTGKEGTPAIAAYLQELYEQMHANTIAVTKLYIEHIRRREREWGLPTISIGVEERHIDKEEHKNNPSTILGSTVLMRAILSWAKAEGYEPPSKLALQTGAMHGLGGTVDFGIFTRHMRALEAIGVAVFVQHGTSTISQDDFRHMPESGTGEAHLATEYQKLSLGAIAENLPLLADQMRIFLQALMDANMDIAPEMAQRLKAAGLLTKRGSKDYAKFKATWDRIFAVLGAAGLSERAIFIAIVSDSDVLNQHGGKFKGKLKNLTKELSGPFKYEIAHLPRSVKAAISELLSREFARIFRVQAVDHTNEYVAQYIPADSVPEARLERPLPLRAAMGEPLLASLLATRAYSVEAADAPVVAAGAAIDGPLSDELSTLAVPRIAGDEVHFVYDAEAPFHASNAVVGGRKYVFLSERLRAFLADRVAAQNASVGQVLAVLMAGELFQLDRFATGRASLFMSGASADGAVRVNQHRLMQEALAMAYVVRQFNKADVAAFIEAMTAFQAFEGQGGELSPVQAASFQAYLALWRSVYALIPDAPAASAIDWATVQADQLDWEDEINAAVLAGMRASISA